MQKRSFSAAPHHMFLSLWRYRDLVWQMTKREVLGRYRSSLIGLLWSFFNPILMLAVYTFVFGMVFRARWGVSEEPSQVEFAIVLFVGLITFGVFAECANRAPSLILSNVNFVKKVVFPLEILPWVSLGAALFHALVSIMILLVFFLIAHHFVHWTVILLPLVWFPFVLLILGVAWFLAATGVFIRDVGQVIGIITTAMLFLSPVFYPLTALPEDIRWWFYLNPLTFILEQGRLVTLWGEMPDWKGLLLYFLVAFFVVTLGFAWFQSTRKGFADVI